MIPKKSLNRITLINILSTLLLQGISMLTAPVISRLLGVDHYGMVSIYNTWVPVLALVLGMQVNGTLSMAKVEYPEENQKNYQSAVLFLAMLVFLVGGALITLLRVPLGSLLKLDPRIVILMVIHAFGTFCVTLLNNKLTLEFKADKNLLLSVSVAVLSFGLSLLLIFLMPDAYLYWGRVLGLAVTYGCFGVGISVCLLRSGKTFVHKEYWKFCVPLALPLIAHGLAGLALGQSDRVMLQQMLDTSTVGIYSLAAAFASVMTIIWTSLNNSWVPFYFEYARNGQQDKIKHHGKNYLELYSILTVGFMLLTPEVYRVFASREYWDGISMIPILVAGNYFIFLYSFPANYEFFHKNTKATAVCTVIAGVVNILLNFFFIRWMGVLGAALATMIAHGVQFLVHYLYAMSIRKGEDFPFRMGMLMTYGLPVLLVTLWITARPGPWWLRWALGAAVGVWELYRIVKRKHIF